MTGRLDDYNRQKGLIKLILRMILEAPTYECRLYLFRALLMALIHRPQEAVRIISLVEKIEDDYARES